MNKNWIIKAFIGLVPIILVGVGFYFWFHGSIKKRVYATANDIQYIAQNIHEMYLGSKYQNFDTDTVVYKNILPFSIEPRETPLGYQIHNRFDGKMYFYEAFSKLEERTMYFALYNNPEKYQEYYKGYGAYIILLTGLSKRECVLMSRVDWRRFIPNFVGLEISVAKASSPFNGMYNLKHYLLLDNLGEKYDTKDEGIISRRSLSEADAEDACACAWKACMIALKFI